MKIWRYDLRPEKKGHSGWGIFVLCADGYFSCYTDYGNYVYFWSHTGCDDLRRFLIHCDASYIEDKFSYGKPKEYNGRRTLQLIKETVLRYRREGTFNKDEARAEWDLIKQFDQLHHHDDFERWCQETQLSDTFEYASYGPPGQVVAFVERLWPRFKERLKQELQLEETLKAVEAPPQNLSPGAQQALKRPENYAQLTPEEQWAIDQALGLLDWDGK